jgi:hypothetical protein
MADVGSLKIDGYSDYLHPVGDGYLLGIGKDAKTANSATDKEQVTERGAFYQGVKLSLFDVRDVQNMREISTLILGKRGSSSAANYDHHGVTWLADSSGGSRIGRLAIPVEVHDIPYPNVDQSSASAWYDWNHTGLYQFEVSRGDAGLTLLEKGALTIESRSSLAYPSGNLNTQRSVIVDESVHYVHDAKVTSAAWGATE